MNGPRVIVTRPVAQAQAWVSALAALGLEAKALPLIDIGPAPEPEAVREAWRQLSMLDFVMFVSANAAEQFFALRPQGWSWPANLRAGSTGGGTTVALLQCGVPQDQVVQPAAGQASESESLWRALAGQSWRDRCVLVVRGEDGRNWLAQQFQRAGATVRFVVAYQRRLPLLTAPQARLMAEAVDAPARHVWLFSSSEAVRHLQRLAPEVDWTGARAVATHERIALTAISAGFTQTLVAQPRLEAIVACLAHLKFDDL